MDNSIVLFRPVGMKELVLIEASEFSEFPPRLSEQPYFYPVLNEEYAIQIARDWNARLTDEKVGFVTRFNIHSSFISKYESHVVGGREHKEYWIPAEDLEEFNNNIIGKIEVICEFRDIQ